MTSIHAFLTHSHQPVLLPTGAWPAWRLEASVAAGFPSPAEDHAAQRIDVMAQLVQHPQASFQMRVRGMSMVDEGIADGDVVLIDRAIAPRSGHIVVAVVDGEFTVKKLYKRGASVKLQAGNPGYPDIVPQDGQTLVIWGVVTACIKPFKT